MCYLFGFERDSLMYIDLHNHFLPGVDDGAAELEQALAGLKAAAREKVSRLCFTPHIWEGRFPNSPGRLREVFNKVREAAKDIPVELYLGSEVFYTHGLADCFKDGLYIPIGEKKRYLLVELSTTIMPAGVADGLYKLMLHGVEPILAHPERYHYVQKDHKCLTSIAQAQIPMQATTQAITGAMGVRDQKTVFKLLDLGLVSFVASDAHHPESRPLLFREAVRILNRRYGHTTARLLSIENPRRILEGRHLLPVAGKNGKRSPFS
jgi:protein-tyrosine phosphatase